jgi:thiol-disulfide isomerase/thioredoxin
MILATLIAAFGLAVPLQDSALATRLSQERGKVVVVNFWAVWCEPCKREMPMLARLAKEYESRGVTFLGASIDDEEEIAKAKAFALKSRVAYPLIFGATTAEMISFKLGDAVPVTVLLTREGQPRFRMVGELNEKALRERLDWLIDPQGKGEPDELVLPSGMSVEHFKEDHESGESEEHKAKEAHDLAEGGSSVPG